MGKIAIYTTGGKLDLTKCFWISIVWRWKKEDPVLITQLNRGKELQIKESESGELITIQKIKPGETKKRLGLRYAFDGNWRQEYKYWLQFSSEFLIKLNNAKIDRVGGGRYVKLFLLSPCNKS